MNESGQTPRRIEGRRRSQWFRKINSAVSRDFIGALMPIGVVDSRSQVQSSHLTTQR